VIIYFYVDVMIIVNTNMNSVNDTKKKIKLIKLKKIFFDTPTIDDKINGIYILPSSSLNKI